jgi:hypothetical protein
MVGRAAEQVIIVERSAPMRNLSNGSMHDLV